MVPVSNVAGAVEAAIDVHSSNSNKKQRTNPTRSADQAAAAEQPRQTQ
jgi:hypothetical protein